jgi:hypothetical protein
MGQWGKCVIFIDPYDSRDKRCPVIGVRIGNVGNKGAKVFPLKGFKGQIHRLSVNLVQCLVGFLKQLLP